MAEAEVRPLGMMAAGDAAAAALRHVDEPGGSWMRRVSIVMARRVDGVDVETEFLWEMEELSDRG